MQQCFTHIARDDSMVAVNKASMGVKMNQAQFRLSRSVQLCEMECLHVNITFSVPHPIAASPAAAITEFTLHGPVPHTACPVM